MIGSRRRRIGKRRKSWWVWWSGSGGDDRRGWRMCVLLSSSSSSLFGAAVSWMHSDGICPRGLIIEGSSCSFSSPFVSRCNNKYTDSTRREKNIMSR